MPISFPWANALVYRSVGEDVPQAGHPGHMATGTSLFLITLGAVLWLAVKDSIEGVDLETVGLILLVIGVIGLIVSLWQTRRLTRDPAPVVRDRY